ncbi:ATP-grasp domain-containing protein [Pseudonocardia lacus]|uniref:ATP-grasp domain-containing protein n=1 Tax=Pseudonocardia lacus TaxID=2835865 RepID=UPI001BDCF6A0|nr:ATP-grasp domain-containing protein [Pseudonocardia lacus]
MIVLFPSDGLRPRRPDEHFAAEAAAARDLGLTVALVDHDALAAGGRAERAVARVRDEGTAVYRGWMLDGERYAEMAAALAGRGVRLRTDPAAYRAAHELPGWYDALAAVTPESVWTDGTDRAAFETARLALAPGPAVLRDHTKSMKHHWAEAMFVPDLTDADAAWAVATRFRELREEYGGGVRGGFVLRRFERFASAEARTWWVDGRCALVGPHPDAPHGEPWPGPDLAEVAPLVAGLGLPFVTVDVVRHADGRWRVVELGDGQVSDRPAALDPAALVSALRG